MQVHMLVLVLLQSMMLVYAALLHDTLGFVMLHHLSAGQSVGLWGMRAGIHLATCGLGQCSCSRHATQQHTPQNTYKQCIAAILKLKIVSSR